MNNYNYIKNIINNEKGVTLVLALLVMVAVTMLGLAIISVSTIEVESSVASSEYNVLFYYADGRMQNEMGKIKTETDVKYGDLGQLIDHKDFTDDNIAFNFNGQLPPTIRTAFDLYGAGKSLPMAYGDISLGGSSDKPREWWHYFIIRAYACQSEDRDRYYDGVSYFSVPQKEVNTVVRRTYIY
jgi:hypothetical protein